MSDATPQTTEAREADGMGERPDLGRKPDGLAEAIEHDAATASEVVTNTGVGPGEAPEVPNTAPHGNEADAATG